MFKNNKRSGFTLIELMIVVAIIGILAAVAIPNYQKYQAKARTTEAKLGLGGAYTAEKAYFAENATYTACLSVAGYAPDGYVAPGATQVGPTRYYSIGFSAGAAGGNTCGNGSQTCLQGGCTNTDGATFYLANKSVNAPVGYVATQADLGSSAVSSSTFSVGAFGYVGD